MVSLNVPILARVPRPSPPASAQGARVSPKCILHRLQTTLQQCFVCSDKGPRCRSHGVRIEAACFCDIDKDR